MDFHGMKRKDLFALCKKHNLLASGTNTEIAERLASHLKKPVVVEESKSKKVKFSNLDKADGDDQDLGQSSQIDFDGMKRKDLQALCKKHNLHANGTNAEIAERLASHLKKPVVEEPKSKKEDLGQSSQIDVDAPVKETRSKRGGEQVVAPVPMKKLKRGEKAEDVEAESKGGKELIKVSAKRPPSENVGSESEGKEEVGVRLTRRGVKEFSKEGVKKAPHVASMGENVDSESKGNRGTGVETSRPLRNREVVHSGVGANLPKKASSPKEATKAVKADRKNEGNTGTGVETNRSLRNREVVQGGVSANLTKKASTPKEPTKAVKADPKKVEVGNIDASRVGTRQTRARKSENEEADAVLPVVKVTAAAVENETQQATRRPTRKSVAPTSLLPDKTSVPSKQNPTADKQKKRTVASRKSDGRNGDKAFNIPVTETSTRQTRARKAGSEEPDAPLAVTIADTETQIAIRAKKRKTVASPILVVKSRKVSSSADLVTDAASERNGNEELGVRLTRKAAEELTKVGGKNTSSVSKLAENVDSKSKGNKERSVRTTRTLRNRDVSPSGVDVNPPKKASCPKETARTVKVVQNNDHAVGNFAATKTSPRQMRARKGGNEEGGGVPLPAGNVVAEDITKKTTRHSKHSSDAPTNLLAKKSSRSNRQRPAADEQKKGSVESRNSDGQNGDGVGNITVTETSLRQTRARNKGSEDGDVSLTVKNVTVAETGTQQALKSSKRKSVVQTNLMVENLTLSSSVDMVKDVESEINGNEEISAAKESTKVGGEKGSAPLAAENIIFAETGTPQATRSLKRKSHAVSNASTRQTRSRNIGNEGYTPLPVETAIFSETGTLQATKSSRRKSTAPTNLVAEMRSEEGDTPLLVEDVTDAENKNQQGTHSKCQSITPTNAVAENFSRQSKQYPSEVLKVSEDSHAAETVDGTSLECNLNSTDECAHLNMNAGDVPEGVVLENNDDAGSLLEAIHDKEKKEPIQICEDASNLNAVNEGLEDKGGITEDVTVSEKMRALLEETTDQVKEKHVDGAEGLMKTAPSNVSPKTQIAVFELDRETSQQTNRSPFCDSSDVSSVDVSKLPTEKRQEIAVESTLEDRQEDFEGNLEQLNAIDYSEEIIRKEDMSHSEDEDRVLITSTCSLEKSQETSVESTVEDGQKDSEGNLEQLNDNVLSEEIIRKEDMSNSEVEDRVLITSPCPQEKRQEIAVESSTLEDRQEDVECNLEQLSAVDHSEEIIRKEDISHSEDEDMVLITSPCSQEKRQEIIVESTVEDGQKISEGNLEQPNANDLSEEVIRKEDMSNSEVEDRVLLTSPCSQEERQEIIVESTAEGRQKVSEGNLEQVNANDLSEEVIRKEDMSNSEDEDRVLITSPCSQEERQEIIVESTAEDRQKVSEGNLEQMNANDPAEEIPTKEDIPHSDNEDRMLITSSCSQDNVPHKELTTDVQRDDLVANVEVVQGLSSEVEALGVSADYEDDGENVEPLSVCSRHSADFFVEEECEEKRDSGSYRLVEELPVLEQTHRTSQEVSDADIVPRKELTTDVRRDVPVANEEGGQDLSSEVETLGTAADYEDDGGKVEPQSVCSRHTEDSVVEEEHEGKCGSGFHRLVDELPILEQIHRTSQEVRDTDILPRKELTPDVVQRGDLLANEEGELGLSSKAEALGMSADYEDDGENVEPQSVCSRHSEYFVVEKGDTRCSPNFATVEHGGEAWGVVLEVLEEHNEGNDQQVIFKETCREQVTISVSEKSAEKVDDQTIDRMDQVKHHSGSEEEWMFPDRIVDRKEDIGNAEGTVSTSAQDIEEVGYQENHMVQNTNDTDGCCVLEKSAEKVDDHATDGMDNVNLDSGSEEESMNPDRFVDRKEDVKEDIENVEGSLGTSEQDIKEVGYQENMVQNTRDTDECCVKHHTTDKMDQVKHYSGSQEEWMFPDRIVDRREDIGNAEGTVSTSPQDMEEVSYKENHMVQNTNDTDDRVLEKSAEEVDHVTDGMDKVNPDSGSEEESMYPDRTVDREDDVKEDIGNVEGSLGTSEQDTEALGYQENHMVKNTEDTDECRASDLDIKEACEVQREDACLYNQCQPGVGNSGNSVEAISQMAIGSAYGFDAPMVNEGNKEIVDDVKSTYRTVGYDFSASGNVFTGANTVNEDATKNLNIISDEGSEASEEDSEASWIGQEFSGDRVENTSVSIIPLDTLQGDVHFYPNSTPGEVFDKQETSGILQEGVRVLETEEVITDTEPVEKPAIDEEAGASQSLSFEVNLLGTNLDDEAVKENLSLFGQTHEVGVEDFDTEKEMNEDADTTSLHAEMSEKAVATSLHAVCASPEEVYPRCPPVIASQEHFRAHEGVMSGLHSEHIYTHSVGEEGKSQGIVSHHAGDSTRVPQVNLCFGLEEQMLAETVVDPKDDLVGVEGMALKDTVHQAEVASDCNVEGSVVEELSEQEKHMIQQADAIDYHLSVLDYSPNEPCEDKENSYVNFDFPEAADGSSLCSSDLPRENVVNTTGDLEFKYETISYGLNDWEFEALADTSNKLGHNDQTSAGGPVFENRVEDTGNKLELEDETKAAVYRAS